MAKKKAPRRMNRGQRAWCRRYERETGFEPMMDDFLAGNESFESAAQKSVLWFEDWANDAHLSVSRDIPHDDD